MITAPKNTRLLIPRLFKFERSQQWGTTPLDKKAVYTDSAGRFEGPAPDTELLDLSVQIKLKGVAKAF